MTSTVPVLLRGELIAGCYKLGVTLGSGSNAKVFIGTHIKTGIGVAVKVEMQHPNDGCLRHESDLYKTLQGAVGIPKFIWFSEAGPYNALVLDKVGPSLQQIMKNRKKLFSLKTVLMLAEQMLTCIQVTHEKGIIHRDITTSNLCMGSDGNEDKLFLIDFGLAMRYQDPTTGQHVYFGMAHGFGKTTLFGSAKSDCGMQQSRIDDLQSIGYVLIYLLKGELPWQVVKGNTYEEYDRNAKRLKMHIDGPEVCVGCRKEFVDYLDYCRKLKFDGTPDYEYLRKLFRNLFKYGNYKYDNRFHWDTATLASTSPYAGEVQNQQTIEIRQREQKNALVAAPPRDAKAGELTAAAPPMDPRAGGITQAAKHRMAKVGMATVASTSRLAKSGMITAAPQRRLAKPGVITAVAKIRRAKIHLIKVATLRRSVEPCKETAAAPCSLSTTRNTTAAAECRLANGDGVTAAEPQPLAKGGETIGVERRQVTKSGNITAVDNAGSTKPEAYGAPSRQNR